MVEVFKTNVTDHFKANQLLERIHQTGLNYHANFDLDDCDRILRVKCPTGLVEASLLIELLREQGYHAEVLPD
ncbi:MAG: hypothetical protein MUD08_06105 [Cytophagales bacterium]|nr:hypothetical protein [Cytophagales bacterium]